MIAIMICSDNTWYSSDRKSDNNHIVFNSSGLVFIFSILVKCKIQAGIE